MSLRLTNRFTAPSRLFIVALSGLLLAACSSSSGSSASAPAATTPSAAASESAPASVEPSTSAGATADVNGQEAGDLGTILVDGDGNTIYFFANDEAGVSNCSGECLANWPPVEASGTPSAGEGVTAELGTFDREDGTSQLTVNGYPAYYFANDAAPGDTNGQGQGGVWWVFGADGEPIES